MKHLRYGFSLIELLVVISVLAILAGLAFPVFTKTKDRAHQTTCASNLRQLGNAIQMYQQDFDDRFPFAIDYVDRHSLSTWRIWDRYLDDASNNVSTLIERTASDGSPFGGQIDRVLRPWTTSEGVWQCPGDTGLAGMAAATAQEYTENQTDRRPLWRISRGDAAWGGTSYYYRTELGLWRKPAARLRLPSATNVFMDAGHYWHTRLHRRPNDNGDFRDYNQGSFNVLYSDNHVRNISSAEYDDTWWDAYNDETGNLPRDANGWPIYSPFK